MKRIYLASYFAAIVLVSCVSRSFQESKTQGYAEDTEAQRNEFKIPLIIEQRGRDQFFMHRGTVKQTKLTTKQVKGEAPIVYTAEYGQILIQTRGITDFVSPYRKFIFLKQGKCFFEMEQKEKDGIIKYLTCGGSGADFGAEIRLSGKSTRTLIVYPQRRPGFAENKPKIDLPEYVESYSLDGALNDAFSNKTIKATNWAEAGRNSPTGQASIKVSLAKTSTEENDSKMIFYCPSDKSPSFSIDKNVTTTGLLGTWTFRRTGLEVPCTAKTYFALQDERILWGLIAILYNP